MFDPRFPWLAVGALALAATGMLVYYVAVISGWYKDSLMGRFRSYGAERRPAPLLRLLEILGWWSLMLSSMFDSLVRTNHWTDVRYMPVIFFALMIMAWGGNLLIRRVPSWREALPLWYYNLLRDATRQERRLIAFAWLRIPAKMRWRLNADQASFQVWADTVRITVIYGARDPDDPWAKWH